MALTLNFTWTASEDFSNRWPWPLTYFTLTATEDKVFHKQHGCNTKQIAGYNLVSSFKVFGGLHLLAIIVL